MTVSELIFMDYRKAIRLLWAVTGQGLRFGVDVESSEALAVDVSCADDELTVVLEDGRSVSVPLVWFPRLLNATRKQRQEWEFIGGGVGIHWEEIDEDISVASLLQPEKFMRLADPAIPSTPLPARSRRAAVRSPRKRRATRRG